MEDAIRIALIRAGLSQTELAARVGVHTSTISRVVCGWLVPPEDVQEAIRAELEPHGRRIRFGWRIQRSRRTRRTSAPQQEGGTP